MQQVTVYIRRGCHLCTEMTQALERLRPELGFDVTAVDIDAVPELVRLYNTRIPVLIVEDVEICYYFLEEQRLRDHLQAQE
ncbi:MAG: glutaredoxin family protein [Gammaproteobacteria bacterium]|nr:glutaredoxin family protein [Gammaproteobacteria bacterium]